MGRQTEDEAHTTQPMRSKSKRGRPLIALVVVVVALIVGELAFQWAKHRGWTTYTEEDGLADNHIQSIAVAPDGTAWIGTYAGGVSRFDGQTWSTYTTADGLSTNHVECIAVAPDGAVWVSTVDHYGHDSGVSRFDGEIWTTYNPEDGLVGDRVFSIAAAPNGTVWFDTYAGVSSFDGESWTTYTEDDGLVSDRVDAVAVALDGTVWFGTDDGISGFDGEKWTTYTATGGLAGSSVEVIAVAPDGTLWSAGAGGWQGSTYVSCNGVSRFDGETWTTYTAADGLLRNQVRAIAVSTDGVAWFGTKAGVSRFDPLAKGAAWTAYTTANSGLCDDSVVALAVDGQGRVWIGTHGWGGLSMFVGDVGLLGQVLHAWCQAWGAPRILGIAASVLLAIVWIVRRFQAKPAVQWVLRGAVSVGLGVAVGWFIGMCGQIQLLPADASAPMPPPDVSRAYVGMAVGGGIAWAVWTALVWLLCRQQGGGDEDEMQRGGDGKGEQAQNQGD